jgi:[histone H3]-N6,N6-dimethyl-lysine9 N-methyltransferase
MSTTDDEIIKQFSELFTSYYENFIQIFNEKYLEFIKNDSIDKDYSFYLFKKIIKIHRKKLENELVQKFNQINSHSNSNFDVEYYDSFIQQQIDLVSNSMNQLLVNVKDQVGNISTANDDNRRIYETDFLSDTEYSARNEIRERKNKKNIKRSHSEIRRKTFTLYEDINESNDCDYFNQLNCFDDEGSKVRLGMKMLTLKDDNDYEWVPAKLNRIKVDKFDKTKFFLIFENKIDDDDDGDVERLASLISFCEPSNEILPVQSRVVGLNKNEHDKNAPFLCAGTIIEIPSERNMFRYLIIFDNGIAQYSQKNQVLPIVDPFNLPKYLNEDHVNFLKHCFQVDFDKRMVRLVKNQFQKLLFDFKWYSARVVELDCSMAKFYIQDLNYTQWLYRGSFSIYSCFEKMLEQQDQNIQIRSLNKYTLKRESPSSNDIITRNSSVSVNLSLQASTIYPSNKLEKKYESSAIDTKSTKQRGRHASKTTTITKPSVEDLAELTSNMKIQNEKIDQGKLKRLDLKNIQRDYSIAFTPHPCTATCVDGWEKIGFNKEVKKIFMKPLACGWQRHYAEASVSLNGKCITDVFYIAPCGRRLRNIFEVDRYLMLTDSSLTIDMFSHDQDFNVHREFEPNTSFLNVDDFTEGKESVPISCVNCVDNKKPEVFEYSKDRINMETVPLITDPNLLDGCNCEDGCRNPLKCSCWLKTFEATTFNEELNLNVGYRGKRLKYKVENGIFECNSKCKCDHRCSNRVAQNDMKLRLQLYKVSESKGWGIRCLDDIPKGAFICNYNGHILSEEQADIRGKTLGDEYFAALDLVETFDRVKELSSDSETEVKKNTNNSSTDHIQYIYLTSDEDEDDDLSESSNSVSKSNRKSNQNEYLSIIHSNRFFRDRNNKFYYKNFFVQSVYILDAKICGNLGRYFNHSCQPNIFVQNVFVDTYDLRFPWIAFFASKFIKAGTELCWDYQYQPDTVEDKILYCSCGSNYCKGRLL